MRAAIVILVPVLWWSGCGERPRPMLHRMTGYAGTMKVTPDGGTPVVGEFAFHRLRGNMQVKFTFGARVVTVLRGAEDQVTAFENAAERPATPVERLQFSLFRDLCDPAAIEKVAPGPRTYRVRRQGVWYTVELESVAERMHGQNR